MKLAIIALSTAALIASPAAFAQGVSSKTPGHQMQKATQSTALGAPNMRPVTRCRTRKIQLRLALPKTHRAIRRPVATQSDKIAQTTPPQPNTLAGRRWSIYWDPSTIKHCRFMLAGAARAR